ncbi:SLAM family member 5-like, partial [Tiliqua scincoides]|uniref:SLAM family member 5-like n=1 Tax=Tiliqua scincoides TaxID=71010 RepID=UPI003461A281
TPESLQVEINISQRTHELYIPCSKTSFSQQTQGRSIAASRCLPIGLNWTPEQDEARVSNPSQNQDPSRVNGMQGGSVLLQINSSLSGNMVNKIDWVFQPKGSKPLTIAEFQGARTQRPNPRDRFGERLEAINETRLRIKDLELEDAGVYEARVRLSSAENDVHIFSLTVHKPVPEPQIWHQVAADTPSGCNVTLQCQAPGPGEFSVSWRRGSPPRSLPNSLDSNLTCLVSSAVDQKEASFDLLGICSFEDGSVSPVKWWRHRFIIITIILLLFALATVWAIQLWKKKKKKPPKKRGNV